MKNQVTFSKPSHEPLTLHLQKLHFDFVQITEQMFSQGWNVTNFNGKDVTSICDCGEPIVSGEKRCHFCKKPTED